MIIALIHAYTFYFGFKQSYHFHKIGAYSKPNPNTLNKIPRS